MLAIEIAGNAAVACAAAGLFLLLRVRPWIAGCVDRRLVLRRVVLSLRNLHLFLFLHPASPLRLGMDWGTPPAATPLLASDAERIRAAARKIVARPIR